MKGAMDVLHVDACVMWTGKNLTSFPDK